MDRLEQGRKRLPHISMDEPQGVDPLEAIQQFAHDNPHNGSPSLLFASVVSLLSQHYALHTIWKFAVLALITNRAPF